MNQSTKRSSIPCAQQRFPTNNPTILPPSGNYCAYHPTQHLTNFCTSSSCLLPVCPQCIKIHSLEHCQRGTSPEFEKLSNIFSQVSQSCLCIMQGLGRLKDELLEVQKVKKENQALILEKVKLYRNKLIREFQRSLMQVEYDIVQKFKQQDEAFINQIETIDTYIDRIETQIQQQLVELEGQQALRTVIFHLSQNYELECLKEITGLNQRIKQMLKRNLYLEVQEHKIDEIKQEVFSYLKLGAIEWGLTKNQAKGQTNADSAVNKDQVYGNITQNNKQQHKISETSHFFKPDGYTQIDSQKPLQYQVLNRNRVSHQFN